jgi:phosphotransferase system enzyme I (PtsI)
MCGEMAGEPALALLLLGLGLDEFSMPPQMIPEIKFIIRSVNIKDAREMALNALKLSTSKEVEDYCQARLKDILK